MRFSKISAARVALADHVPCNQLARQTRPHSLPVPLFLYIVRYSWIRRAHHILLPSMGRIAATTSYALVPCPPAVASASIADSHVIETPVSAHLRVCRRVWLLAQSPP